MATVPQSFASIYLQDIIQLTKRGLVDRCLGVSRRFNRMLSTTSEAHLPRRRLELDIQTVCLPFRRFYPRTIGRKIYINSYVFQANFGAELFLTPPQYPEDRAQPTSGVRRATWNNLAAINECPCREDFTEASRHLIGQVITRDAVPTAWISIRLYTPINSFEKGRTLKAVFTARNTLTEPGALGLLHLLYHLSADAGSCLETAYFDSNSQVSPNYLRLNEELGSSLGGQDNGGHTLMLPQLRCKRLLCDEKDHDEHGLPKPHSLFSHCQAIRAALPSLANLQLLLRGIASPNSFTSNSGHCVVRKLEFDGKHMGFGVPLRSGLHSEAIDTIIRFFQQEEVRFESCIPHVVFPTMSITHDTWPSLCPRMGAISQMTEVQEHCFINELSGEKFHVRLVIEAAYRGLHIREFHLLFNCIV